MSGERTVFMVERRDTGECCEHGPHVTSRAAHECLDRRATHAFPADASKWEVNRYESGPPPDRRPTRAFA